MNIICEHYIPKIVVNYKNKQGYQGLHLVFDQAPCSNTTQKAKSTFTSASEDGLYTEVDAILDSESDQDKHDD
jgi:hypothetical protein